MNPPVEAIHGLKGVITPTRWWTPTHIAWVVFLILVVLGILWLILTWMGRAKKTKQTLQVPIDPWIALKSSIAQLAAPRPYDAATVHLWVNYASVVSLTARRLLGFVSKQPCEDWTTEELRTHMQKNLFASDSNQQTLATEVLQLLTETDRVQFADRPPSEDAHHRWLQQLQQWWQRCDEVLRQVQVPSSLDHSKQGGVRVFD